MYYTNHFAAIASKTTNHVAKKQGSRSRKLSISDVNKPKTNRKRNPKDTYALVLKLEEIFETGKNNNRNLQDNKKRKPLQKNITEKNIQFDSLFQATSTPCTSVILMPLEATRVEKIQEQLKHKKKIVDNVLEQIDESEDEVILDNIIETSGSNLNIAPVTASTVEKVEKLQSQDTRTRTVKKKATKIKETGAKTKNRKRTIRSETRGKESNSKSKRKQVRFKQLSYKQLLQLCATGKDPIDLLGESQYYLIKKRISLK